jgi:hypothetical protein
MIFFAIGVFAVGAILLNKKSESDATSGATVLWFTRFDNLLKTYAKSEGVRDVIYNGVTIPGWMILKSIALNESDLGRAKSVARGMLVPSDIEGSKSSDGKSWGLMQVTIKTAKSELDPNATEEKLNNPEYSIRLGAKYVAKLQKSFSTLELRYLEWVVKSYNQGPGNTLKEKSGQVSGYAKEYWERFLRNLERVQKG